MIKGDTIYDGFFIDLKDLANEIRMEDEKSVVG